MKNSFKKIILFVSIFFLLIASSINILNAQDKGISLNPAFIEGEVSKGQLFDAKIEIQYINFKDAESIISFKEFDEKYFKGQDSQLLKEISEITINSPLGFTTLNFEISTNKLENKTYFFAYEIKFQNIKSQSNISEQIAVRIPIILTINTNPDTVNPKPRILINNNRSIYFSVNEIGSKIQIVNLSSKYIKFAGEIVYSTDNDEIFYTQRVGAIDDRLFPRQAIEKEIQPDLSKLNNGIIPYFGNIKVYYRGTVNNTRHIQTEPIKSYILPYQIIIAVIVFILILLISIRLVSLRIRKRNSLTDSDNLKTNS